MDRRSLAVSAVLALSIALGVIAFAAQGTGVVPTATEPGRPQNSQPRTSQESHPSNDQSKSAGGQPTIAASPAAPNTQRRAAPEAQRSKAKIDRFEDWLWRWHDPPNFAALLLFVIGAAGICVGIRTLFAIQSQTRAAVTALKINRRIADAAKKSADVALATLVVTQRGFVHIGGWGEPFLTNAQSCFFYHLTNRGQTQISIERGEIKFFWSSESQSGSPATFDIPAQSIGPREDIAPHLAPLARFPPMTAEALAQWTEKQPNLGVFLSGDILYRDVFPNTPLHHKWFGVRWDIEKGEWVSNASARNDEKDEPEDGE